MKTFYTAAQSQQANQPAQEGGARLLSSQVTLGPGSARLGRSLAPPHLRGYTLLLLLMVLSVPVWSGPSKAPSIELRDQFNQPHSLKFPRDKITILTLADRKGADEVDGWIAALRPDYSGRCDFQGIAQMASVPALLQGHIRKKFQEVRTYPVMMDWSGKVCAQLDFAPSVANLLVVGKDGAILARFTGPPVPGVVADLRKVLDRLLEGDPG